ncbi:MULTISPECIES: DUF7687 domain-containing protein [Brevibacillus]|nr:MULTISPECIES: hypothetical protein [Brevibacillus]MDR9504140.1 hypothetical protein [Brevibacillus agri]MED1823274.1 hypothetical protein [Brevibacillus agri]MED3501238.1 hypothetical protein [Brevibacillus agri]MED4571549.1 hypothetical protein [Brevibacillus agri]QHZ58083.1 hypothetical protein M655_021845 [Brevibacillus sp. NSP2.1]
MRPNPQFLNRSSAFWAYTKLISEKLNYSKDGEIKKYSQTEMVYKLQELGIIIDPQMLGEVKAYLDYRADLLNGIIKRLFMDVHTARAVFYKLQAELYEKNGYTCALPFNKQKGEKKDYAYFTGIVNILTEHTLRTYAKQNGLQYGRDVKFDDNPLSLSYITDEAGRLQGIMSRRFDGAYPGTENPLAIWEVKEYYYTTTFGSRIADGVYETQLDGFEINTISKETQKNIQHIYFIDDFNTWWNMGKSYLCRIVDMLHVGHVDEVIFGKEVLERWPKVLHELLAAHEVAVQGR